MPQTDRPSVGHAPKRRWLWILLSFGALMIVLTLLWEVEDTAVVTERTTRPAAPIVSVVRVHGAQAQARVSAFAELRPRWDAEIRAAVPGRIVEVQDAALAGTHVSKGTALFTIQRTPFETAVAAAEMTLEQSRLALLQAQNQVAVAKRQFERDDTEPPNDLALNLPQLRIAKRGLAAAEAQLTEARRQLADTVVEAPFSGIVTQRLASLGQTVSAGEALLHLSDDQQFELVAELSQAEWSLLEHPIAGRRAALFHRNGQNLGDARIRQGGGYLDPDTRQMRIFLEVSDAEAAILSGDFLRVVFTGRTLENTLTLPDATLTRAGFVWFVDADSILQRVEPTILFRSDTTITIAAPDGVGPWNVATAPLASFLPGQRVTPQLIEN